MNSRVLTIFLVLVVVGISTGMAGAGGAMRVSGALWADGELYDTVITPTSFVSPPTHSIDILYNFDMSGLMGQRSVSESAPGDRDYNGGRWSVKRVVFTDAGIAVLDANDDGYIDEELTSAEEILAAYDDGYVEIMDTTTYFECPLLPRRNR